MVRIYLEAYVQCSPEGNSRRVLRTVEIESDEIEALMNGNDRYAVIAAEVWPLEAPSAAAKAKP